MLDDDYLYITVSAQKVIMGCLKVTESELFDLPKNTVKTRLLALAGRTPTRMSIEQYLRTLPRCGILTARAIVAWLSTPTV